MIIHPHLFRRKLKQKQKKKSSVVVTKTLRDKIIKIEKGGNNSTSASRFEANCHLAELSNIVYI